MHRVSVDEEEEEEVSKIKNYKKIPLTVKKVKRYSALKNNNVKCSDIKKSKLISTKYLT